jgi:hypothetical protein
MRYASVTLSEHKSLTTFPVKVSKDLLDISPYVWLGQNKLCFSQVDSMLDYVLALYSHYPTESQIIPLHARWDERWGGGHTFFVPSYISLFAHSRVVQTLGMKGEKTWHPPSKGGMHRQGHMEKGGGGCKLCVFASPTPFGHLLACHITHRRGEHTDSRCRREEGGRVLSNPSHTSPITIHISVYWVT